MLNSLPVRILWHSFNWLTRLTIVVFASIAVLAALTIIVLRYWLLPDIERYHDNITASLSTAIGSPVSIGKIEGDWQGLRPSLSFADVHVLDEQRQPALVLPRINSSVSWISLINAELQLTNLEIDRPELLIRRDAQGKIYIGGVPLSKQSGDNNKQGGDNDLANWLLHQPRMVVRDAIIVWVDEMRAAPALQLKNVNLRIESLFNNHRFALRAVPPSELATPLDVRGDFHGASFDNLGSWHGKLFTQLDYTDIRAWRPWLDLPKEFSHGRGALRGWLGLESGTVKQITVDLALRDVVTKLAEDTPEMVLLDLRGRAAWKDITGGLEVSTNHLMMRLQNGVEWQPTDFYFRTEKPGNGQPAKGEMRTNLLQLESLAGLANFLPLDAGLRAKLDAYAPRGKVSGLNAQWHGAIEKPDSYKIRGQFENLAVRKVGEMPGFSGLSVDVDGSETSGNLNIKSHQLSVDATGMMREPLFFTTLTGQAGWQRKSGELSINVDNIAVVNDDLTGSLHGGYQTKAGTLGVLDMTVNLTHGDVRRVARYTPLIAVDKEVNDWLNDALQAGHTQDMRIRIKGNLSDFPLDSTEKALFEIGGHAQDVVVEFAKGWPRIEHISGEFLIHGNKLQVKSPSATMLGARLQNVTVNMPDMRSADLPLEVNGEAVGASNTFLQFIQQSPVRGYIDSFTDGMSASGNGHLDLFVHLPLMGEKPVKVSGTFRVQDNDINLGEGVPLLRKTRGELLFTESGMRANSVLTEILGGAASMNMRTATGGVVHATVKGYSNLDVLRNGEPHPVLNYLHGGAAWDADISVEKKFAQVVINSTLQGIDSSLPQPFNKRAEELMPLRLEKKSVTDGQDVITAQLGELLSARLARRDENGVMAIKRGTIRFGGQGKVANSPGRQEPLQGAGANSASGKRNGRLSDVDMQEPAYPEGAKTSAGSPRGKDGVWIVGSLPILSVQGWEELAVGSEGSPSVMPITGANLFVQKLTGYGQIINGLSIEAVKRGDGLTVQLSSDALNGEVVWQPHVFETNGKLSAHLSNLQWLGDEQSAQPSLTAIPDEPELSGKTKQHGKPRSNNLPALEIVIENLQLKGKHIGRFELVGHPDGQDWRLRRLHITNPDGSLVGDGTWRSGQGNTQTQINLLLEISDAGKVLARSGYPNTVKNGKGKLFANMEWTGSPDEFNYATLNGTLKLDTSKGQFLKMEPGIGKLLGILSLQALPKRITLDFTDVFSEGFQFDNINGNATIRHGVMDTQDFHIDGSSAKVTMKGSVDLNSETQNLRVRILPTLGDSVSLLGAFAAGPMVGIGSLIINKVFGNPLDKLVSFEYNVGGTWSEPTVVKVGQVPVSQKEINPGK